jgi:DNA replication protein DnaC
VRHATDDIEHPLFGRALPCPACGPARRQKRYDRRMERVQEFAIPMTDAETFEKFEVRDDRTEKALEAARAFVQDPTGWLVLWGGVGTGKTHLAKAIAQALQEKPITERPVVLLATVPDLLRSGYDRGDYDELVDMCREIDVLMLDDLGTERTTDWAAEQMFAIINHRYNARKPTVITTNVDPRDLEPRLASRIQDRFLCTQVHITSSDYRVETNRAAKYAMAMNPRNTFETFKVRDNITEVALEESRDFARDPTGWLVLWGGVGTGKTHLTMAIAQALQASFDVLPATVPDLLHMLRSGYKKGDYDELVDMAREIDVLMLDDLGTERSTDWAAEQLFAIVNHRYNAQKPTVITTNVNPRDLEPRLASRIQDRFLSTQVHITSTDYRTEGGRS